MSTLTDKFGLNLPLLLKEGKLTFDESTGEFHRPVTIKRDSGSDFTTTVQIAKFDLLNLYVPSKWYLDKKNKHSLSYRPKANERLLKPLYSIHKGCESFPNVSIVEDKGTIFDINARIIQASKDFEKWYEENAYNISRFFFLTGKYLHLELFIKHNVMPERGVLDIFGKHYAVIP